MRITQCDARSLEFFDEIIFKKWNMTMYVNKNAPVMFFGCYSQLAKVAVMNNRSITVIVWSGGDSLRLHEMPDFVDYCKRNEHRVFHYAHSWWIQKDLELYGIKYIDKVILPRDLNDFQYSDKVGTKVYHYGSQDRDFAYGSDIVRKIWLQWNNRKGYPEFHKTNAHAMKLPELINAYKESFVGVRLTEHDNMALSCIELGLMGRPSIFNGNIPGAIPFPVKEYHYEPKLKLQPMFRVENLESEVARLILEASREPSKLLAEEMREFVFDDEKWLYTETYE